MIATRLMWPPTPHDSAVRSVAQLSEEEDGYRPPFTHQFFDDERIMGYTDGSVTIRVVYLATSLDVLVEIKMSDDDPTRSSVLFSSQGGVDMGQSGLEFLSVHLVGWTSQLHSLRFRVHVRCAAYFHRVQRGTGHSLSVGDVRIFMAMS